MPPLPLADQSKHQVNWQVDFARPLCPELLSGHLREIAEEALERCVKRALILRTVFGVTETR